MTIGDAPGQPPYGYFLVAAVAMPPPANGAVDEWVAYSSPRRLLEQQFVGLAYDAEFVDLPNLDRAYRIPFVQTHGLRRDRHGQFIMVGINRFSLTLTDPTLGVTTTKPWQPVG